MSLLAIYKRAAASGHKQLFERRVATSGLPDERTMTVLVRTSASGQQATFEVTENENSCGGLQDAQFFDRQSRKCASHGHGEVDAGFSP